MNLNLTHLMNFIKVVEWGNVSKAALRLNIAQPALSRQIRSLEAELNTTLLFRQTWGVEPTEDGKRLLEHAQRIQKECVAAYESIRSSKENPTGSVYLGVPSAYSVSLVPPLMRRLGERYPNITVHIVEGFSRGIHEWLLDGRLDLAVLYQSAEHGLAGTAPFLVEELAALCAPEHHHALSSMTRAELANRQVIVPWQPHFLRQVLDDKFHDLGIPFVPKLEMDSMRCMIEMAQRGDGVVILPPSCVVRELAEGRLAARRIDPSFHITTFIAKAPGRQKSQVDSLVIAELSAIACDLAPDLGWSVPSWAEA